MKYHEISIKDETHNTIGFFKIFITLPWNYKIERINELHKHLGLVDFEIC